jgi:hypothetical protein
MSWLDDLLGFHDVYAEGVLANPRRKALEFKGEGGIVATVADDPLTGRTVVTHDLGDVEADSLELTGHLSWDGGTSFTGSATGTTTGAGSTFLANIDTSEFGDDCQIELSVLYQAIETGGGANVRLKRTQTFKRTGGTLSSAQAIESFGTDLDETSGGVGAPANGISSDDIRLQVTGASGDNLTWKIKYTVDIHALP